MRFQIIIGLLLLALIQVSAASLAQNVTINVKNASLEKVFKLMEKQTGYAFLFDDIEIKNKKVSLSVQNTSVEKVLELCLDELPFSYKVVDKNILFKRESNRKNNSTVSKPIAVQQQTITGQVQDSMGRALAGVQVTVEGTNRVTTTDANGRYQLTASLGEHLLFKLLGHEEQRVKVGAKANINITMKVLLSDLDEIVVVGYGTQKKESLTGSISIVKMAEKEKQTLTHASQALYGTSGIHINQGGAKPGQDGTSIRIRGVNTLSNANPLVLLDGIEYSFNEIDPADIETITVLKDASAAIYGSRASNGVILITSKQGKAGKTKIELRSHGGIQQATYLPDVVDDPILYMQMRNRAEANSGKTALTYSQAQIDEYKDGMLIDPSVYPASNWFDIVMGNGYVQQHNVRATGGKETYNFTVGGGYMKQKGVLIANDDANRYSFDVKVSVQATPKLKINAGMLGNIRENNDNSTGNTYNAIMRALPIFSDYHLNYNYGSTWLFTPGRNNIENPRMLVENGNAYRDYQETLSNINIEYKLPFNITYHNTVGYRRWDHFTKTFNPLTYTVNPKTGDLKSFNSSTAPRLVNLEGSQKQFTLSHRLEFQQQFADHQLQAMIGQEYQVNSGRWFQATNYGFYDNSLMELDALADNTLARVAGTSDMDKLASFYSRLAYDYKGKYILEGTLRYDGSSRFAPGNQWSFFPSVSAGWLISKEDFFNSDHINLLKIRGSIGKLGNQAVGRYAYNSTVNIASDYNYSFGGTTDGGAAISALTDRDIRWESTLAYNGGVDIHMFGKLSITADYFYKRTFDILRSIPIPSQVGGLGGPAVNLGKVDNKGWELGVTYHDKKGNLSYGVGGSVSYVKNKVVDINGQQSISGRYIIKEGYPINSYYLYEADGYFQTTEEIDNAKAVYGTRAKLRPGYIKYVNHKDDNYIDDEDKIITGNTIPDYTYNFSPRIGYKNFVVDAQFQGVANVDVYPGGNIALPFNNGANVIYDWARDSWTPSNPNSKLPLLTTVTDAGENFINSTFWLQDASYLRMKNISLTYNLPENWLTKWGASRMAVYISGQNLWTISKFKMMDPEITTTSTTLNEYPNLKSYSVGLNLTF